MYKYIKAIAALLGTVSPLALAGILQFLRVPLPVDPGTLALWMPVASAVLGFGATYLAPPNAAKKTEDDTEAAKIGAELSDLAARLAPKK